ncbi:MAG: hypothetical protein ACFFBP_05635 [Promethearchaeota archaeon]
MLENVIERKILNPECSFSDDYHFIIDSEGKQVPLDDPRIVFVFPEARNSYGRRLVMDLYENYNRNIRIAPKTDSSIIQFGKKICSGRECLAAVAMTGAILKDIKENRNHDEITIYRAPIDQHGPCQNGGWPVLWKTFSKRLNVKNAMYFIAPNYRNKFLGLPLDLIAMENICFLIGNYIVEARNALYCIAEDKTSALDLFETITDKFIMGVRTKAHGLRPGLLKWAKEVAKIPCKMNVREAPKVLVIGGLNLMFDHYPVEEFFLNKGIIPKIVDFSESALLILSEPIIRYGFKKGLISPEEQFDFSNIDDSELKPSDEIKEITKVRRSKMKVELLETQSKSFRKAMKKSNLLFDSNSNVLTYLIKGHSYVTLNSCTETTCIIGRYIDSIEKDIYDGLINLGTFNCQPAMNSQAIIRPLANKSDIPYAAVDCEGPWISSNQKRLLETIAIQAKRLRESKNKKLRPNDKMSL